MRNLQAQTIFFFSYKHTNNFFSGNGFANIFFLRNAMLYHEEFYVTTFVLPLTE